MLLLAYVGIVVVAAICNNTRSFVATVVAQMQERYLGLCAALYARIRCSSNLSPPLLLAAAAVILQV